MGELARLCMVAMVLCSILVNTLVSGHASCRSLSGVSRWSSKASVIRLNKLRLYKFSLSMHSFIGELQHLICGIAWYSSILEDCYQLVDIEIDMYCDTWESWR